MTTGRIDYSPDYKSEKRKPLNPRVHISAGGRPYLDRKEAVRRMLDSPLEDIAALARIEQNEAAAIERARLERELIERAKEWPANYDREELLGNQLHLALFDAAQSLIEFESVQEKKG